jgi:hypothetical protein
MKTALEQYLAAREYVDGIVSREETPDDRKIDGWRRLAQAESLLFRARAEYAVALKNIHYEKGSILEYKNMRVQTPEVTQPSPATPPATPPAPPQAPAGTPQAGRQAPSSAGTASLDSPTQKVVPAIGVSHSGKSRPAASAKAAAEVQTSPEVETKKSLSQPKDAAKATSASPAKSATPRLPALPSITPLRTPPKERLHSRVNPETVQQSAATPAGKSRGATASLDDTPAPASAKSSKPNVAGRASL